VGKARIGGPYGWGVGVGVLARIFPCSGAKPGIMSRGAPGRGRPPPLGAAGARRHRSGRGGAAGGRAAPVPRRVGWGRERQRWGRVAVAGRTRVSPFLSVLFCLGPAAPALFSSAPDLFLSRDAGGSSAPARLGWSRCLGGWVLRRHTRLEPVMYGYGDVHASSLVSHCVYKYNSLVVSHMTHSAYLGVRFIVDPLNVR
jgi:hypothetical protein